LQRKPTEPLGLSLSERPDRKQIKRIRPLHRQSQAKQNRNFHQTHVRLTTRRFDDIAPDVRDRAIGYRAVIATAAIEVMIELP
jgi:hypothetical protein